MVSLRVLRVHSLEQTALLLQEPVHQDALTVVVQLVLQTLEQVLQLDLTLGIPS